MKAWHMENIGENFTGRKRFCLSSLQSSPNNNYFNVNIAVLEIYLL
jgi:hypothetical protein